MPPRGAPQNRSSYKYVKFVVYRFVSMPTVQLKHSYGEPTLIEPGEPPEGTPNGAPPDFHRNAPLYGINRFVSMHTLNLQHSSGEPTFMGPGSTKGHPRRAPSVGTYSTSVLVKHIVYRARIAEDHV